MRTARLRPLLLACGSLGGISCVTAFRGEADCEKGARPSREEVVEVLNGLQTHFVEHLQRVQADGGRVDAFNKIGWLRNEGANGGGTRYGTEGGAVYNRASVNVSAIHYEDKAVKDASALSVILHPAHPRAPSMHFHISLTTMKKGGSSWRMIADLNPSHPNPRDTAEFESCLQSVLPNALYAPAESFGDKYFYIPALRRHRGVKHLFVAKLDEAMLSGGDSLTLAKELAEKTIVTYCGLVQRAIEETPEANIKPEERQGQLEYHTAYLFQVLTLDRGTTHGILAHDQNDRGILASLPSAVDLELLESWGERLEAPQKELLQGITMAIKQGDTATGRGALVNEDTRAALAGVIRRYYKTHGRVAMAMQAEMDMKGWEKDTRDLLLQLEPVPSTPIDNSPTSTTVPPSIAVTTTTTTGATSADTRSKTVTTMQLT